VSDADEPGSTRHPSRRRGYHAAPPSALRSLVKSGIAVAAVAVAVALLQHVRAPAHHRGDIGPVITSPTPRVAAAGPSATATPSPTTASASPRSTAHATPVAHRSPGQRVMAPLVVLNDSRITGLAHRAAAQFEAKGWTVTSVGNYSGTDLAVTTVFFTRGDARQRAAAHHLAAQFTGIRRIAPRSANSGSQGLTVVLTRDYPA
jgi:LytR cell envelope-related transcriptional attenuator